VSDVVVQNTHCSVYKYMSEIVSTCDVKMFEKCFNL